MTNHYEDQRDEVDRKDAEMRAIKRNKLAAYIDRDIRNRDIATVLADIVLDPTDYKHRSR